MDFSSERKLKRVLHVGKIAVGGDNPVSVQSMTTTKTSDALATINQIRQLEAAGCEIVRVAIPDMAAAQAVSTIKESVGIPVVADIHFDYRLALETITRGIDALRLNPGDEDARLNLQKALQQQKQEQQQQKKDNKEQKKPKDDPKKKDQQQQQENKNDQPRPQPSKMTKKEAEEKLKALLQQEKKLQDKLRRVSAASPEKPEKDW